MTFLAFAGLAVIGFAISAIAAYLQDEDPRFAGEKLGYRS